MQLITRKGEFFKKRRFLIACGVLILGVAGWWPSAYPRGMLTAWIDQLRGHDEIQACGFPRAVWNPEYCELLDSRYGVQINQVTDCAVSPWDEWYVRGYNSVAMPRINSRFGKDVFADCWKKTIQE